MKDEGGTEGGRGGADVWRVVVNGEDVGVCWAARGGGYTLRTGDSLVQPIIHHFSHNEGLEGLEAYVEKRFGARPELRALTPDPSRNLSRQSRDAGRGAHAGR